MKKKSKKEKTVIKRAIYYYWQEMKHHKGLASVAVLLTPIVVLARHTLIPFIIAQVIQIMSTESIPADQLWTTMMPYVIAIVITYFALNIGLGELRFYSVWKMEVNVMYRLNNRCFEALSKQSMNFHNNRFGGSLVSQVGKFVGAFERLFDIFIWNLLPMVLVLIYTAVILWQQASLFVILLFAFIMVYVLIAYFSFKKVGELNKAEAEAENKRSGRLADAVTNILTVKSYGQESMERRDFKRYSKNVLNVMSKLIRASVSRDAALSCVSGSIMVMVVVFLVGGPGWFGIPISIMILIVTYTQTVLNQIWEIPNILRQYNRVVGDSYEMTKILDMPNTVTDIADAPNLSIEKGAISIRDVMFQHADTKDPLFKNFNLNIEAGQSIGLVGRSGSGKTTLTKLLLRFSDVDEGKISIDGQNIAEVTQESLRQSIAYVPQETTLFHRTIAENIAYGRPDATQDEIIEAAKLANAWEFIKDLPKGLDTLTGERGVKLSGGQRQRVAIARAILKDAPILIMDEATASLDTESEKLIQEAMGRLMQGRTNIIIAHRLSTVSELDRVIVLDHGKIVEDGTHEKLVKKNGVYAKLWNKQTGMVD